MSFFLVSAHDPSCNKVRFDFGLNARRNVFCERQVIAVRAGNRGVVEAMGKSDLYCVDYPYGAGGVRAIFAFTVDELPSMPMVVRPRSFGSIEYWRVRTRAGSLHGSKDLKQSMQIAAIGDLRRAFGPLTREVRWDR
jgi:hypothetical protein